MPFTLLALIYTCTMVTVYLRLFILVQCFILASQMAFNLTAQVELFLTGVTSLLVR